MCVPRQMVLIVLLTVTWLTPEMHGKWVKKERVLTTDPQVHPPLNRVKTGSKTWKRQRPIKVETTKHIHGRAKTELAPPPSGSLRPSVRHSEDRKQNQAGARKRKQKRHQHGKNVPHQAQRGSAPSRAPVTPGQLVEELWRKVQESGSDPLGGLLPRVNLTGGQDGGRGAPLPSTLLDDVPLVTHVHTAFHVRLTDKVAVPKKTSLELHKYHLSPGDGAFQRGEGLNLDTGRFTAPYTGVYQLSTQVIIRHKRAAKGTCPGHRRSRSSLMLGKSEIHNRLLRVLICIDSQCRSNMSLQYIRSMETAPRLFTASLHGILQLARGQHVSVHMDNISRFRLVALPGSQFSGAMLGL